MKEGSGIRTWRSPTRREGEKSRRDEVAELIRALMDGPKTVEELGEFVTFRREVIRSWCEAFHAGGVIRICDRKPGNVPVYEHQKSPFALPDMAKKDRRPSRDSYAQRGLRVPSL